MFDDLADIETGAHLPFGWVHLLCPILSRKWWALRQIDSLRVKRGTVAPWGAAFNATLVHGVGAYFSAPDGWDCNSLAHTLK